MVKMVNFTLWIFYHNQKKREGDRLFKIQKITEKQLVFSLNMFRNEIEDERDVLPGQREHGPVTSRPKVLLPGIGWVHSEHLLLGT